MAGAARIWGLVTMLGLGVACYATTGGSSRSAPAYRPYQEAGSDHEYYARAARRRAARDGEPSTDGPTAAGRTPTTPTPGPEALEPAPMPRPFRDQPEPLPINMTAIEDSSGQALRTFFQALSRASLQEPGSKATIVQFGDSHTAGDFFSGEVRRGLQRRFGDGGRGFLFPGRAFKYYYQRDVKHGSEGPWTAQNGLRTDALEPLGLGGIRMSASSPKASLYLETCGSCDTGNRVSAFEIYFWRHATGGFFQIKVDGEPYRVVDTRTGPLASSSDGGTGYFRVEVPDGPHRLEIAPSEGTVDLFGIVMERDTPGVSYDALGLNGALAATPLHWTWELAGEQLSHRDPDLLVTAYGTNESAQNDFRLESYIETYRQLLLKLKSYAPRASCLVIGPPDRVVRARKKCPPEKHDEEGNALLPPEGCTWEAPLVLDEIVEVQRAVALENGCAFWDTRKVMGGPGVMEVWAAMTPALAQADHTHLTREGYERLADALLNDLMTEYDRYTARTERAVRSDADQTRP